MKEKYLLKTLTVSTGFVLLLSFTVKIFGISDWLVITFNIDFIPLQIFLMFFHLISK